MRMMSNKRGMMGAIIALLVVAALIAGGIYWYLYGRVARESAFNVATLLPKSSRIVFLLNASGQIDPIKSMEQARKFEKMLSDDEKAKAKKNFVELYGFDPEVLTKVFHWKGAAAVLDLDGKPGLVALAGLKDPAEFEALVSKFAPKDSKKVTVSGVEFTADPDGVLIGHDSEFAYFAKSQADAEALLAAVKGGDNLASDPLFQEAHAKVERGGSLAAMYFNIKDTLPALKAAKIPYTDDGTYSGLSCLEYAVSNWDYKNGWAYGFLKVAADDSSLSKTLLAKGGVNLTSFGGINKKSSAAYGFDAEWFFNAIVSMMAQFPETRQAAAAAPMGLVMMNPFAAYDGEVVLSIDALDHTGEILEADLGRAGDTSKRIACSSNLKNIATALEMYSTDYQGRYPAKLAELTPDYLRSIPQCPAAGSDSYSATYKHTDKPYSFEVACQGDHHGQGTNLPSYNSETGINMGDPLPPSKMPVPPSGAVTATVKDLGVAHSLMVKALGEGAGAAPVEGKDKQYPIPNGELYIKAGHPPRLCFGFGQRAKELLETKDGSLADVGRLKEVLGMGNDSVVYADYLNLTTMAEDMKKLSGKPDSPPGMKAMAESFEGFDLECSTCVSVEPDGLRMTSHGIGGSVAMLGGVMAAVMVPNFIRARAQGQATACKSNLKNIGTALEMWSTDHGGKYPDSLSKLTPEYLKYIPECPAAGKVTYTLRTGPNAPLNDKHYADYYYLECKGHAHEAAGLPADYPKYTAIEGLIDGH